jgi:hypothetical protein
VKEVKYSVHEKCVRLEGKTFPGGAGIFAAAERLNPRDIAPAMQRSGKRIDRHVLAKLRCGDMIEWDTNYGVFHIFSAAAPTTCCHGQCLWLTIKLLLLLVVVVVVALCQRKKSKRTAWTVNGIFATPTMDISRAQQWAAHGLKR